MSDYASELELAAVCAKGDAAAITRLRTEYLADVLGSLRRLRAAEGAADELESRLLEHLLVGAEGRPPRIAAYAGSGSLRGFLQAAATRLLLTELRKAGARPANPSPSAALSIEQASPALAQDLQAERSLRLEGINQGLRQAVVGLTVRERNLLRQHYVDGLTTEQVARLYGVHRATAVRWLADAREAVLQRTKDAAIGKLGVRAEEVDSLFEAVRSRLDLSLSLFLTQSEATAPGPESNEPQTYSVLRSAFAVS